MRNRPSAPACAPLLLIVAAHGADIIPADRRMDWTPGVTVGVPGGIPDRATIFVDVRTTADARYRCAGDGVTDDSAALARALADCPSEQVVYVPAGRYALASGVRDTSTSRVTLRGDGQGRTVFVSAATGGYGSLNVGDADWPRPPATIAISSGATRGSTALTVADTSTIPVGALIRIDPANPTWVHALNGSGSTPVMTFVHRVVARTATTVTFSPPLPMDLSALTPRLAVFANPLIEGVGLESFTLECAGSTASLGIEFEQAWGCWVRDVEIAHPMAHAIFWTAVSASEVRHCRQHDVRGGGPNHEGLDLYQDCCWNLIEDNIVYDGGFPGIILGDSKGGCQGNAIAYNFCYATDSGDAQTIGADISFSHGPHNVLNLLEGNVCGMIESDGYWGSSSHGTVFRNWATMAHPTATYGRRGIDLCHGNPFYAIVGNVIGTDVLPAAPLGQYETEVDSYPYYADPSWQLVYRLGYPNMGNASYTGVLEATTPPDYTSLGPDLASAQQLDRNVRATIERHGNFDYVTRGVVWDPTVAEHTIPASLLHAAKPTWFGALAWPPIDPARPPRAFDDATLAATIPAGYRYVHGEDPPAGGGTTSGATTGSSTTGGTGGGSPGASGGSDTGSHRCGHGGAGAAAAAALALTLLRARR